MKTSTIRGSELISRLDHKLRSTSMPKWQTACGGKACPIAILTTGLAIPAAIPHAFLAQALFI
jgi:hypothetical protein